MIRWYHNPIVIFFTVVIGVMLAMWGYSAWTHRGDKTPFQQKAEAAHDTTKAAELLVARTDTLWLPAKTRYLTIKEKTKADPQAREVATVCDSALALQDRRIAARDTLNGALKRELTIWQNKPGPARLVPYGEALYDLAHMVPVLRVGATFRVAGPINLSGAAEYAAPPAGRSDPAFRAVVGVRYTF